MKKSYPSVCIIILNYFDHISTTKCVESLLNQKFNTLYLVDNSGDEGEAKLTEKIKANFEDKGVSFNIELLINQANLGFGTGVNVAVDEDRKKTGGHDYYLLLNNDALLVDKTIETLVQTTRQNPNVALVSPAIEWAGKRVTYHGYFKLIGHVTSNLSAYAEPYISGCCLLVDKCLLNENKQIFDEDFFMYSEDIELNWRAKKMGKEIYCAEDVTIFHEGSGSSSHGGYFYEYHVARGHWLLGIKAGQSERKLSHYTLLRIVYLSLRSLIRTYRYKSIKPLKATFFSFIDAMRQKHYG